MLLDRPDVPVLMNRLYPTRRAARAAPTGQLRLVACAGCGFTFNSRFDPALAAYDEHYENDQTNSELFSRYVREMRARLIGGLGGAQARVLEIGCGQGEFLETLVIEGAGRIEAVGCDTVWRPRPLPPGLRIEAAAFDAVSRQGIGAFDLIYARHVIEHVAAPVDLLRDMAAMLGPGGRVCIETPALEWVLANNQMQDFFYEHCNYFTAESLREACRRAGLEAMRVETVFGGQYLWAEAIRGGASMQAGPSIPLPTIDADFFRRWQTRLPKGCGSVAIWGAGAKGVTFATEIDPPAERIACLIDINPNKQRLYTPRSGHPVVAPAAAQRLEIDTIVVMNPNYRDEIVSMAEHAGLRARLLSC